MGEAIGAGMIAKGIVPLGWYDAGARPVYNPVRPINTIADKGPFQAAMAPVYDQFLSANPDLQGLVDLIRNAN